MRCNLLMRAICLGFRCMKRRSLISLLLLLTVSILASLLLLRPTVLRSTLVYSSTRTFVTSSSALFRPSPTAQSPAMSVKSAVESAIADNHIAVFSKS